MLRSQLLVLLQRRQFCDAQGRPLGRPPGENPRVREAELETEMRTFFQRYFTHNRYISATSTPLDALQLDVGYTGGAAVGGGGGGGAAAAGATADAPAPANGSSGSLAPLNPSDLDPLAGLYLDLRPYMNRSPFTVRRDCSAARAHQAFVGLGLRHLVVVDALGGVAGIITRKDLDHAAGHGWWRMSAVAPKPHRAGGGTGGGGGGGGGGRGAAVGGGGALLGRVVGQGGDLLRKLGGGGATKGGGGGGAPVAASSASARLLGADGAPASSSSSQPPPPLPQPPGGRSQDAVL
jgi:chloride channel 7